MICCDWQACFLLVGWVNTLVGGQHHGAKGFAFFSVDVDLTEEGIGNCPCF